jgi:hypothetical protein
MLTPSESTEYEKAMPSPDLSKLNQAELFLYIESFVKIAQSATGSSHKTMEVPVGLLRTAFDDKLNTLLIRNLDDEHKEDMASNLASGWLNGNALLARERQVECTAEEYKAVVENFGQHFTV